jgi:hypothetical protein
MSLSRSVVHLIALSTLLAVAYVAGFGTVTWRDKHRCSGPAVAGDALLGKTADEVRACCGDPDEVSFSGSILEVWQYDRAGRVKTFVYFDQGGQVHAVYQVCLATAPTSVPASRNSSAP